MYVRHGTLMVCSVLLALPGCRAPDELRAPETTARAQAETLRRGIDAAQIPTWTDEDLEFFLHGSMGTEVVPARVLAGFSGAFPELLPADVGAFGLLRNEANGQPIGVSGREVEHLGGAAALGINCASCHLGEVTLAGHEPVRVVGMTSHFDAEAFFGAVTVAMLRAATPEGMTRFLVPYLLAAGGDASQESVVAAVGEQRAAIERTVLDDPSGSNGVEPGRLHDPDPDALGLTAERLLGGADLAPTVRALLETFHNMRVALHLPSELPSELPPPAGPGRNNAFGLLSESFFGVRIVHAPVKFGLVWDLDRRARVHWDGNNAQPIARNLAASLGLGAPTIDGRGLVDFALVQRHTDLTEAVRAPRYPAGWPLDRAAAERGADHYEALCASCHDVASSDPEARLHDATAIGTDPLRARQFDRRQQDLHDQLFRTVAIDGYTQPAEPPFYATGKYWAVDLGGVWARSPYLHNGSVRTMWELLSPAAERASSFRRGTTEYDAERMGYRDGGAYLYDVSVAGNSNSGHEHGAELAASDRRDLIEYLKTL
jgi:hypothetical protein